MRVKQVVLVIVLAIVIAAVGVVIYTKGFGRFNKTANSGYQAVFLTNGQVYFGKLASGWGGKTVSLTDIYYLQVDEQSALQPKDKTTDSTQPKLTLIKLGAELHGPTDKMEINRDHVLFTEKLKSDSKVVTAIGDYIKSQNK